MGILSDVKTLSAEKYDPFVKLIEDFIVWMKEGAQGHNIVPLEIVPAS